MSRRRTPPPKSMSEQLVSVGIPVAMFISGALFFGFNTANGIATKPYVDDRFAESRRYTDEKTAQTLKEAFEHSDANRKEILLIHEKDMEKWSNAITEFGTKTDLTLDAVRRMRDEAYAKAQRMGR